MSIEVQTNLQFEMFKIWTNKETMKTLILIILTLFLSFNNSRADSTEVIIIGTVHYETENFNTDSLYNIFVDLKPDLILMESDASYMTEDFLLRPGYEDIANETRAVTKYLLESKPLLRPYDIENRDHFLFNTNRRRTERNFFEELSSLYSDGDLSEDAFRLTDELMLSMDEAQSMTFSTPFHINQEENKEIIEKINYYDFEVVGDIIRSTPELSSYDTYWKEVNDFWMVRNNAMVENIKKHIKDFQGRRIIVLCGFAHKPYLEEGLKDLAYNGEIKIKNYWED
jgi:hypothetical protein